MAEARSPVVVTGTGVVCAIANDSSELIEALEEGRSGIGPIRRFDTSGFSVHIGAEVKGWGEPSGPATATLEDRLCCDYAARAAREALEQAGVRPPHKDPTRIGIVFGTNLGDLGRPVHELAGDVAARLGIEGPRLTVCTACSSSTGAIGLGCEMLLVGSVDLVVAGGSDVLTQRVFAGFHALGVLSAEPCAPFSTPFGTTLGEGAGFVILERAADAAARGAPRLVSIAGYGLSGDGHHETSPDPGGRGVAHAIRFALDDAGVRSADIGYVNAHGSGTAANDPSEWRGIRKGLGDSDDVWVSSSKAALGHAQGAAGALEAIVTILMMRRGLAPPTLNFTEPRHFAPEHPVPGPRPVPHRYQNAVCVNSGFGGANAALVVSASGPATAPTRSSAPVRISGIGLVSRHGLGTDAWSRGRGTDSGRVPTFSLDEVDRRLDPRGLDRSSLFLTAAASMALSESGVSLTRLNRLGAGLILGATRPSPESLAGFDRSIQERGLTHASAPAFARIVLNAPAGVCSKLLYLQGPLTTVTVGQGSGLAAIMLAARQLQAHPHLTVMLGAAVDELDPGASAASPADEGAACVALTAARTDEARHGDGPRIVGWGLAGPGRLDAAIAMTGALAHEAKGDSVFDEARYARSTSGAWALPSAMAMVDAVSALRSGAITKALVTSDLGDSMSMALLLQR